MANTLRITHHTAATDTHTAAVELSGDGIARQAFTSEFNFTVSPEERERLQWYLETYLIFPQDPAPQLAEQAEQVIASVGERLFEAVFANRDADRLWARLEPILPDTRIEVTSEAFQGWPLPWELLRDPVSKDYLAIRAREFVRTLPEATRPIDIAEGIEPPIRILLAICRPQGRQDVGFRSVARPLINALVDRDNFQLDVLRPPTFDELAKRLRQAKADSKPYHVLHFDGHGAFLNIKQMLEQQQAADFLGFDPRLFYSSPVYPRAPRTGSRGYLAFENDVSNSDNLRLVDGPELGSLLAETGVPLMVLNACRSGQAAEPTADEQDNPTGQETDRHERVRAFGSLAQEIMDAGVAGVLAMRYNVYVVTAAQFVGNLYEALSRGSSFGAAASAGRKDLFTNPSRAVTADPVPLQDWCVPIAYEAAPIQLFTKGEGEISIEINPAAATPGRGTEVGLPNPPAVGFWGRDETLFSLDRAFDRQSIVLTHAFAGSGKTAVAAEFARWYSLTGGVDGPVLFTAFERYLPLARVLDTFGQVFGGMLEQNGIDWLTLDDTEHRDVALQVMKQKPLLWVWDNIEPITGFPEGTPSAWTDSEQTELLDFLKAAARTKAKFLLISRRDERKWLGELPMRLTVPPMPMADRLQLAQALAEKRGQRITDIGAWRPLLRFTDGNPLTITVLIGQALREGWGTKKAIQAFAEKLRAGEAEIDDEE